MIKVLRCNHCGNIVTYIVDKGVTPVCCGEKMEELTANTTDAAQEKHVPVVTVEGSKVTVRVGEVDHPMLDEHYIMFVLLETEKGVQKAALTPGSEPVAVFALAEGDKAVAAYEYCNLHGLWKKDI